MKQLDEYKAEIFCRSENKIKQRKNNRNRILAVCIPLCLVLTLFSFTVLSEIWFEGVDGMPQIDDLSEFTGDNKACKDGSADGAARTDVPDNLSFALTWNTYGISSYDSATGKLIKTTGATNPEDYITVLKLDETRLLEIWKLLCELDIETYPDEYCPHGKGLSSKPSMTLILTVRDGDKVKTVRAENIVSSYECDNPKGQKFLDTCKGIRDILIATEEWKALPECEFFYQ